ncbi:kinase-like domain-containing protein [Cyathus striatus]|nr:kinase-like domain-containing protein [Cyathus striatus]
MASSFAINSNEADPYSVYHDSSSSSPKSSNPTQLALNEGEKLWRQRYSYLLEKGYELRPRYRPDWRPSWLNSGNDPAFCEDGIAQFVPIVLDATRVEDGSIVCLKLIDRKPDEPKLASFFSSEALHQHSHNHCVPILDAFRDPFSSNMDFIVMPALRPFNDPEFANVDEVVDFVTQILEGLDFMHSNLFAHGDCTGANIMMDARPIFPNGWHFVADDCGPDGFRPLRPLHRTDNPVRYFFIDFGLSHRYLPGESPYVLDAGGRDSEVPELTHEGPWDLYKIDVFTVGNMFYHDLLEVGYKRRFSVYCGLDFLQPLIKCMKHPDPQSRFNAKKSLGFWYTIRSSLSVGARWRLQKRGESVGERVLLNTVDVAIQGLHQIRRLFKDDTRSSPTMTLSTL